jgi:magnesium transporter
VHQSTPQITDIIELLNANNSSAVAELFAEAHPADIADALEQLTPANRPLAWVHVPKEAKGEVLAELSEGVFKNLAHELDNRELVNAIKALDIDELADLIPDLPEALLADVLFEVDTETRANLGEVLSYPEYLARRCTALSSLKVRTP